MKPRILIIGAGPSGSVLALALLHNNIPVRIIESNASHPYVQWHSSSILPRCLELFTMLGFVDDVLEQAIPVPIMQHYKSSDRTQVDINVDMSPRTEPTPASPFLHALLFSQASLQKVIRAALSRKECTVEKGIELVSFSQTPEKVNVKLAKRNGTRIEYEEESYDWMIAADGAVPSICNQLGFEFHGDAAEICNMLMGEVHMGGVDPRSWHIWGAKPPESHVSLRAIEKPGYFSVNINGERVDHTRLSGNTNLLRRFLQDTTGNRPNFKFGDIPWVSVYHPDPRILTKFLEGRVLVAGVATSLIPPQALTSAVQDACNLAWKLALVHKRIAPYSILNSYSEERLPVIAQMIDMTFSKNKATFEDKRARAEIRKNSYDQLGVNCRWSSIVYDERKKDAREEEEDYHFDMSDDEEEEEEVLDAYGLEIDGTLTAGDRAPDAPGLIDMRDTRKTAPTPKTIRLFQLFGPSHHTVLVFVGATRRWASVLRSLSSYPKGLVYTVLISRRGNLVPAGDAAYADFALEDRNGHAHDVYVYDDKYGIVIVRPDGVVGAIVKGTEGIEWYFHGIFVQRKRY